MYYREPLYQYRVEYCNIVIRLLQYTNFMKQIQTKKYDMYNNEAITHSLIYPGYVPHIPITLQGLLAMASRIAVPCSMVRVVFFT